MGWDVLSQLHLGTDGKDTTFTKSGESNDDLSLKEANEKEIETNPNTVSKKDPIGVQKAEAAALVWSKKAVYATYAWVWVCFFMLALQSSIMTYATVAAYSTFSATPAYTTASILGNIVGGVLKLPIAKLLNLWGRAEGFVFGFTIYLVGLIILAAGSGSTSYAAGYTLYWIGYDALYLIMDVFVADTSGLRNRAWAFAFVSTPFICTAFTGPLAANSFLAHTTWRWAIAAFCIIQPVVFLPLAVVFKFYQKKAQKMGLYRREPSGRTTLQSIVHYFHEFDVIGALLLMAAFVILLLPFSLITYARITFDSPTFVAMVIVGVLLFPVFAIWEKYFARTHFVRWELFRQRTLLGACLLAGVLFFSFYCWNLNFYNFCKVVYALKVADAGYMTQIYNVGSTFWGVVFGVWVRKTKHFKYACLCFGLPVLFLGAGLLIHFRGEDHGIGYVIMCQIFIAIGGGMLVIGEDMAAMAACDREGVAMALALIYLSSAIGGAIGDAVAGSIYGATWRKAAISKGLSPSFAEEMYLGGYMKQEMFIPGTMEREAFNYAWSQTLRWGGVASTCILILAIPAIAMWKNYRVDKKQNKGTVI
ncbi:putative siderochrome-iron transporter [Piedraia hortae CBS 480.64]|uniref:Putative siderochrome-iron transporter n=1 Tax=Piedraia hortae CBS 480.64 TaxID=1314780 RepID=A0A6A7BWH6_9PEZI|nr:putative siderochrome-iron transporter [Piedraia hortae CBS 480.64]